MQGGKDFHNPCGFVTDTHLLPDRSSSVWLGLLVLSPGLVDWKVMLELVSGTVSVSGLGLAGVLCPGLVDRLFTAGIKHVHKVLHF